MDKRRAIKRAKKLLQKTNWDVYEYKDNIWDLIAFRRDIGLVIKVMTKEPTEIEKQELRAYIPHLDSFLAEIWVFRPGEQAPMIVNL